MDDIQLSELFSVPGEGVHDEGLEVVNAGTHGFHHVVGGNHSVEDRAQAGEGGSLPAGHLSNVSGSGDGKVFGGNSYEVTGAM